MVGWLLLIEQQNLAATITFSLRTTATRGQKIEWAVGGVPRVSNPYDPDQIRVDATVVSPSGLAKTVPCFWFQNYTRKLSSGNEVLTTSGALEWHGRFTSMEAGSHEWILQVSTNGVMYAKLTNMVTVEEVVGGGSPAGFVRVGASKQYFETGDGQALPLAGANICWPGVRGTFDYDDWFKDLASHGGNFARIWMCPWAFGIEAEPGTLTNYRLDRAWQLDYVFDLANKWGIKLMLCLDYHGMYSVTPDGLFGGNDNWKNNPYNTTLGGPASTADLFFTSPVARKTYEKRLRYLVARYGSSTSLLAWELLNEIDNDYNTLNPSGVASWHASESQWLKTNDPYNHLVTTSLTGSSDRSEIWSIPTLDFSQYHSYGEPGPAARITSVGSDERQRYGKPFLVGEFGINAAGWNRPSDPYLRGFRQALWGGAVSGSAGTAMSWWWENLHSEGVYSVQSALRSVLDRTYWGQGSWKPVAFQTSGAAPALVSTVPGTPPAFSAILVPNGQWGAKQVGMLALPNPDASGRGAGVFNSFVHGSAHADLKNPFKMNAWFGTGAKVTAHVNSVSQGAVLGVFVDSVQALRISLPDKDGKYDPQVNEYNIDISTNVPAGRHTVEIRNLGMDWFYLDWVKLDGVLTSDYLGGWRPSPQAIGIAGVSESLIYAISPSAVFPANATNATLPLQTKQSVSLTGWPPGAYVARWYDPETGAITGESSSVVTNGVLSLALPNYTVDLAGWVQQIPRLTALGYRQDAGVDEIRITGLPGAKWSLVGSLNLRDWNVTLSNSPVILDQTGNAEVALPGSASDLFWRATWP